MGCSIIERACTEEGLLSVMPDLNLHEPENIKAITFCDRYITVACLLDFKHWIDMLLLLVPIHAIQKMLQVAATEKNTCNRSKKTSTRSFRVHGVIGLFLM